MVTQAPPTRMVSTPFFLSSSERNPAKFLSEIVFQSIIAVFPGDAVSFEQLARSISPESLWGKIHTPFSRMPRVPLETDKRD